jgi:hypothetical protein
MNIFKKVLGLVILAIVSLGGCVSQTVTTTKIPAIQTPAVALPNEQLLDVSIAIFDPGLEVESDGDIPIFPEVRQSEARYMPQVLMSAMQDSGAWGAVRVVPSDDQLTDLMISGKILRSDGKNLALEITAVDATNRYWIDHRVYKAQASRYAYSTATRSTHDAFQAVYNRIANDLLQHHYKLESKALVRVRQVAEIRFAERFANQAFENYVTYQDGRYRLRKLPAEGDPMLDRVRKIRARDHLYVDTLQSYYEQFGGQMQAPYQEWRKLTYEEAMALEEVRAEAASDLLIGGLSVLAGIYAAAEGNDAVTRTAGNVAIMGGAYMVKSGLDKRNEAAIHVEALEELGASLEAEITPQVIQLDDQTIALTGNVQDQYAQWRSLLDDIYESEIGSLDQTLESREDDAR